PGLGVAVGAGLQQPRPPGGEFDGAGADAVHGQVVGVAVVAVGVVADQDVGVLAVEDPGEAGGGVVGVGPVQAPRVVVLGPAGHAGVAVAQPVDARGAEDPARRLGLPATVLDQVAVRAEVLGALAVVAVGGEDCDDAVPPTGGQRHHAGGLRGLVVG